MAENIESEPSPALQVVLAMAEIAGGRVPSSEIEELAELEEHSESEETIGSSRRT